MVQSPEKKIIDKVKDTKAFIMALRTLLVAMLAGGGFILSNAKELTGWLAQDTINEIVSDTVEHLRSETNEQFNNLIVLLMKSDPKFKEEAMKMAEEERENKSLLNAVKGVEK